MKKLFILLTCLIPIVLLGQNNEKPYYQLEMIQLEPNTQHLKELADNMATHNNTFHGEGDYQASVYHINTGLNAGDIIWMMGPVTYTEMDDRPGGDDHTAHWRDKVMPHTNGMVNSEIWRRNGDLVIDNRSEAKPLPMYRLRYFHSKWGQSHRVPELMAKIKKTAEATGQVTYWAVYTNEFIQGKENGRHFLAVTGFNSNAELDQDDNFIEKFEEIYGPNSWDTFMSDMEATFENYWDEWWSYDAYMSGVED